MGSLRAAWAALSSGFVAVSSLVAACGGHGTTGFPSLGSGGSSGGDASRAESSDADPAGDDAGGVFTSGDANGLPSGLVFDCQPGTYAGKFTTTVTSDAGGLFALFNYSWSGNLSITLQGAVSHTSTGEIPQPTLTIAPGAKLAGMDAMGVAFNADLSGQLDCPSKALNATIANGVYGAIGDAGGIAMQGTLTATYDGTSSPPTLAMGGMMLTSPQIMSLAADGSWMATLQ
jgi:hypothetical protein